MEEPWLAQAHTYEQMQCWVDILAAHGRPDGGGEPDVCPDTGGRAVFDDDEAARAAVADLNEAGAPLLSPIPCECGDHWHVAIASQ
jgi:hypothetical protein